MKALLLDVCGKALFLCCLACLLLPTAVNACSCAEGAFLISRSEAIKNSYCYSSNVYSARVVGATCNCRTASQNGSIQLQCRNYEQDNSAMTLEAMLIAWGTCNGEERFPFTDELGVCDDLSSSLSVDPGVAITNGSGLVYIENLTNPVTNQCRNTCPFNNGSLGDDYETTFQPCLYTVTITEVFKTPNISNMMVGSTLSVTGPDVLTTCGDPSRRLAISETFLVGVGGACSPINSWSTVGSFSENELNMLRDLKARDQNDVSMCGSVGLLSSLPPFLLALLISLQCSYL